MKVKTKMAAVVMGAALSVTGILGGVMLNNSAITASAEEVSPASADSIYQLYSCAEGESGYIDVYLSDWVYHVQSGIVKIVMNDEIYSVEEEISAHPYPLIARQAINKLGLKTSISNFWNSKEPTILGNFPTGYYRIQTKWKVCNVEIWIERPFGSVSEIFECDIDSIPYDGNAMSSWAEVLVWYKPTADGAVTAKYEWSQFL